MDKSIIGDDKSGFSYEGDSVTGASGACKIRIGEKIGPDGRYIIKDVLGRGGMGEVYLAFDEISKTEFAIKFIPREVSLNEDEMEGIRKNFALVRNLYHPNIAALTALERLPDGEYILVMEAVSGRNTLKKERLSRQDERLPVSEAVKICGQIAEALDYAHENKVIHRDVKPGNVMIGDGGRVKLTDFGLAAQIMSSMNSCSMLPIDKSGTRPYMSPEQWEGRVQDSKTDQWALAVLFYELVEGRLPFPADDIGVLERQVLEKIPEKPDVLSENQWAVLKRALSKEKENRFATCMEFIKKVEFDSTAKVPQGKSRQYIMVGALALFVLTLFYYSRTRTTVSGAVQEAAVRSDLLRIEKEIRDIFADAGFENIVLGVSEDMTLTLKGVVESLEVKQEAVALAKGTDMFPEVKDMVFVILGD